MPILRLLLAAAVAVAAIFAGLFAAVVVAVTAVVAYFVMLITGRGRRRPTNGSATPVPTSMRRPGRGDAIDVETEVVDSSAKPPSS